MEIFIPKWHPTTLNQLIGYKWWTIAKLKKGDKKFVSHYTRKLPKARVKRELHLEIVMKKNQKKADPDAYFKSLNDALTHAGMLVDDSDKWVKINPPTYSRDWDNWGTRITLTDIE